MYKNLFTAVFLYLSALNISAQEVLLGLNSNPVVKEQYNKALSNRAARTLLLTDTIELPFVDDFSTADVYPSAELWCDSDVFINATYGVDPPSIGVATFDAITYDGSVYSGVGYNSLFEADYLTSRPINMYYPNNTTIVFSFYYQPQGLGDAPESSDNLFLEFYSPIEEDWVEIWEADFLESDGTVTETFHEDNTVEIWQPDDSPDQEFKLVTIPIVDANYLQKGFQFRFYNKATLSTNSKKGMVGNCDHWNIDYVYLDLDRDEDNIVFQDVAFVYPLESLLSAYEAVPWTHFLEDSESCMKSKMAVTYKNNDSEVRQVYSLDFIIDDLSGTSENDTIEAGAYNINSSNTENYNKAFDYVFSSDAKDTAVFTVQARITTDDYDLESNNTISYNQVFTDYYAYDDGIAENGYGISGEGAKNGMVAVRYVPYQEDSLSAIRIYFNQAYDDYTEDKYFILTVWDHNDSVPNNIIYEEIGTKVTYSDELNGFIDFEIDPELRQYQVTDRSITELTEEGMPSDLVKKVSLFKDIVYETREDFEAALSTEITSDDIETFSAWLLAYSNTLFIADTFYIGWQKTTATFLNVGFDVSRTANQHLFYNITGEWINSAFDGALMIRPVFKNESKNKSATEITEAETEDFLLYPNPVNDKLYIQCPSGVDRSEIKFSVYDCYGKCIISYSELEQTDAIDVINWPQAMYFVRFYNAQTTVKTQKIMVTR